MKIFNKLAKKTCLGVALGLTVNMAYAAPYIPNTVQLLEDQDAEIHLDAQGAPVDPFVDQVPTMIQVGDLFAGVLTIQLTKGVLPLTADVNLQGHTETFTALFLIEAESITSAGTGLPGDPFDLSVDTLSFGAATQAQWDAVYGAGGTIDISSAFDVSDLDGDAANGTEGIAAGTMAMLFNGAFFDEVDFEGSEAATQTLSGSATTVVDGAALQYEFGFIDDGITDLADQFWTTIGIDAAFPALIGTHNPTNRFALNITKQWAGPDLDPHNFLGTSGNDFNYSGSTHLQAKGDFSGVLGPDSPWPIGTDTDLYIKSVPEPTNLALLTMGIIGAGVRSRRNKK
ncbi:MAG: PEP-CTERM sorting domain-containing protein [Methyloprofundus sp.]|nr:PEP-CTERM sorting domain-containing protein [Methyloprofundus sp.]